MDKLKKEILEYLKKTQYCKTKKRIVLSKIPTGKN